MLPSAPGFNGFSNPSLLSSDGLYRVEAFWLNTIGHFHISMDGFGNRWEGNHNNNLGVLNLLQGIRVTSVSNAPLTLVSMDILNSGGRAAVSTNMNATTGVASWSLISGPGTINFGPAYAAVTEVYFADPGAAGGSGGGQWDNIRVETVPEPGTALLLGIGCVGLAAMRRRRSA